MSEVEDASVRAVVSLAVCVICCLAGCGDSHTKLTGRIVTPSDWKAVLNDWYDDGQIESTHSCAATLIALTHLPPDPATYSDVTEILRRYEAKVCHPGDLSRAHVGMTDTDVALVAGAPALPPACCWYYPVTPKHPGLRVCFTNGHATTVQQAVHG